MTTGRTSVTRGISLERKVKVETLLSEVGGEMVKSLLLVKGSMRWPRVPGSVCIY